MRGASFTTEVCRLSRRVSQRLRKLQINFNRVDVDASWSDTVLCDRTDVRRNPPDGRVERRGRPHRVLDRAQHEHRRQRLTDLALYRLYCSTSGSPCPGSTFVEVATSTSIPPPNLLVSFQLMGLETGAIYSVSVTAVDIPGNESPCWDVAAASRNAARVTDR